MNAMANGKTRVRGGGGWRNGMQLWEPVQGSHSQIIRTMCTCGEHSIKRQ